MRDWRVRAFLIGGLRQTRLPGSAILDCTLDGEGEGVRRPTREEAMDARSEQIDERERKLEAREQKLLEQLEQQLNAEDPHFATSMSETGTSRFSTSRLVAGAVTAAVGLGVMLWGISQQAIWLGIIGFVLMAVGVYVGTARTKAASRTYCETLIPCASAARAIASPPTASEREP